MCMRTRLSGGRSGYWQVTKDTFHYIFVAVKCVNVKFGEVCANCMGPGTPCASADGFGKCDSAGRCMSGNPPPAHTHTHTHTVTHTHTQTHTHIYILVPTILAHTHTYTHIHMGIHTHT